jgi:Protein of unknown function (DUF3293)
MTSSTPQTSEARIAELVRAYLDAEYRWEMDGEWLNLRIGERAPEAERRFPEATRFGLLSAWNPRSVEHSEVANRAADEALQRDLLDSGRKFQPAFSSAVNRSWREPSWLVVDLPLAGFDALSLRYGQLATLHWTRHGTVRLRVDAPRPPAFVAHADIDWLQG